MALTRFEHWSRGWPLASKLMEVSHGRSQQNSGAPPRFRINTAIPLSQLWNLGLSEQVRQEVLRVLSQATASSLPPSPSEVGREVSDE